MASMVAERSWTPSELTSKRLKTRRVSWAPDDRLCQVRLFAAADAPRQGAQRQVQLQAQVREQGPTEQPAPQTLSCPTEAANRAAIDRMIAQVRWHCPEAVKIDETWQLVAGDESLEKDVQKKREASSLEAIYPRASAIPISPVEDPALAGYKPTIAELDEADKSVPVIPLVPVEDEEMEDAPPTTSSAAPVLPLNPAPTGHPSTSGNTIMTSHAGPSSTGSKTTLPTLQADLLKGLVKNDSLNSSMAMQAAAVAFAMLPSSDKSSIDQKLLLELLQRPELLQQFDSGKGAPVNPPAQQPSVKTGVASSSSMPVVSVPPARPIIGKALPIQTQLTPPAGWPMKHEGALFSQPAFSGPPRAPVQQHQSPGAVQQHQLLGVVQHHQSPGVVQYHQSPGVVQQHQSPGFVQHHPFPGVVPHHQSPGAGLPSRPEGALYGAPVHPDWRPAWQPVEMHQPVRPPLPPPRPEWQRPPQVQNIGFQEAQAPQFRGYAPGRPPQESHMFQPPRPLQNGFQHNDGAAAGSWHAGEGGRQQGKRPCAYFNTSRGCRHGDKCTFAHIPQVAAGSGRGEFMHGGRPEIMVSRQT